METGMHAQNELSRIAPLFAGYIDVTDISHPEEIERMTRFSAYCPYGIAVYIRDKMQLAFVSPSFFSMAHLPQPLPDGAAAVFMRALYRPENWNAIGQYYSHFAEQPHDDLIIPSCFSYTESGEELCLTACSRALSFIGRKPCVILTLFATASLFAAQNGQSHTAQEKELEFIMSLSPREYEVLPYYRQNLKNSEIAGILNISINTVKSHKRVIRRKSSRHCEGFSPEAIS